MNEAKLVKRFGGTHQYWRGLLDGAAPITDDMARMLEKVLGLTSLWLDSEQTQNQDSNVIEVNFSPKKHPTCEVFDALRTKRDERMSGKFAKSSR